MESKEKKTKTTNQLRKHYKNVSRLLNVGEVLSAITPIIIIGAIHFDEYFVQYEGWKMTTAGSLACLMIGLVVFLIAKKKCNVKMLGLLLGVGLFWCILLLIDKIVEDLMMIVGGTFFGLIGTLVLDEINGTYEEKLNYEETVLKTARLNRDVAKAEKELENTK